VSVTAAAGHQQVCLHTVAATLRRANGRQSLYNCINHTLTGCAMRSCSITSRAGVLPACCPADAVAAHFLKRFNEMLLLAGEPLNNHYCDYFHLQA
jgi:hypothetical protein